MLPSAFVFGGVPEKAIKKAFTDADIYVSPAILKEYREVPLILEDQNKLTQAQSKALIFWICCLCEKDHRCLSSKENIYLQASRRQYAA